MIVLGIEQSFENCSAALLADGRVLADCVWMENRMHRCQWLPSLQDLLRSAVVRPDEIDVFAVGVGPGSYSGLRVALAVASAWALPGQKQVYGISSADVLAEQTAQEFGLQAVRIVGDARRDQFWTRGYRCLGGNIAPIETWRLVVPEEITTGLDMPVVSADWDRIGLRLQSVLPAESLLVCERRVPGALMLGRLACRRLAQNMPSEPLMPIYLHAAVGG